MKDLCSNLREPVSVGLVFPVANGFHQNLINPIRLDRLQYTLIVSKYNSPESSSILQGIDLGFFTNSYDGIASLPELKPSLLTELVSSQSDLPSIVKQHPCKQWLL